MPNTTNAREVLISLATAALKAAEVDAKEGNGDLIFRPEWRPSPRFLGAEDDQIERPAWYPFVLNQLSRSGLQLQEDQPTSAKPGSSSAKPGSSSASAATPTPAPATPAPTSQPQSQLQEDAVQELFKRNKDVLDELINHPFPRTLGNGTASLDGFRYYMIQDKLYLETCARIKMMAVAAAPNFKDVETFEARHKSSLEYVKKLKEVCVTMLGLSESTIENTPRSVELDASENFYKGALVLRHEDAVLGYYVVLLPCVVSYWEIAKRLMEDPSTVKNVVYHPAWTVVNYDRSSVDKYTKFINANIAAKGGVDRWNFIFRIACQLEAKLFNTGLRAPVPFQIIPDGAYSISLSGVVLAIKNIKGALTSPSDEHSGEVVPSDAGWSVVGAKKTGGDNEKWLVVATKYGYTFRNLGTGFYLGISTKSDRRIPQAVFEPYYWWINPVQQPTQGSSYRIHDSVNLRYTLDADAISVGSTPITIHENSEASCQFASCDSMKDLEKAKNMADQNNRAMQEQIQAIQGQIDQAKWDEGAAERNKLLLIESMCKKICHWAPFHGEFRSASFAKPPITCGSINGTSCFITRSIDQTTGPSGWIYEGVYHEEDTEYEALVGDMGGLTWVTCHGPFNFKSLGSCIPVPLGKIDNTDIDHFVARLPFSGHTFPGAVAEGCEALMQPQRGEGPTKVGSYEVLCYKSEVLFSR